MNTKYQVFVSSTFEDLKTHRDQAVKTILRMGHLPVGMEMFNAAENSQWDIIKRHIDNSDYYVVVLAHRYGSVDEKGVSYTEKEYNYALEKGVPCLGFVIDKDAQWSPGLIETGENATKLTAFKNKIKNRMVSFWTSSDNLALQISSALSEAFITNPRVGWVRANEMTTSPLVAEEISRLSKENAALTAQIVQQNQPDGIAGLINILSNLTYTVKITDNNVFTKTLLDIFLLLCKNQSYPTANRLYALITGVKFDYYSSNDLTELIDALEELSLLGLATRKSENNAGQISVKYPVSAKGNQLYIKARYHTSEY
jgi:hypothetical protein